MTTLDWITAGLPTLPLALTWAGRVAVVSLGIVAAVIALVLFIASRSKWGQNKPLTKCIALAVLAHVWLLMYAYGTRIHRIGPGGGSYSAAMPTSIEFVELPMEATAAEEISAPATLPSEPSSGDVPPIVSGIEEAPTLLPPREDPTPVESIVEAAKPSVAPEEVVTEPAMSEPPPKGLDTPIVPTESPVVVEQGTVTEQPAMQAATAEPAATAISAAIPVPADPVSPPVSPAPSALQLQPKRRAHDQQPVPDTYQLRLADSRAGIAAMFGGDADTEAAVEAALNWLAANQEPDGSWNAAKHGAGRETRTMNYDRQGTGSKADTGISGLAMLAFLGAGHTHDHGKHSKTVTAGLAYLINAQMPSGDLAGPKQIGAGDDVRYARMYCHGMALLALSEAYAMTGDHRLVDPIQRGAAYTLRAQNPQTGGWRYQVQITGDPGDLSQFGWQAMALYSARHAGATMTPATKAKLHRFLDSVASGRTGGLAVYRPVPGQLPTAAMTAEALAVRRLIQYPLSPDADDEATNYLLQALPGRGEENVYYWYYATMALFQRQDQAWRVWNDAMKSHLVGTQNANGELQGSWEPRCIWSGYGGRIYSTAMSCLCLEVYYRYLPLYQSTPAATPHQSPRLQTAQPPTPQWR